MALPSKNQYVPLMGQNLHTALISIQIASARYTSKAKAKITTEATVTNISAAKGHDTMKAIANGNNIHRFVVSHNLYLLKKYIEFFQVVPIHATICLKNVLGTDNRSEK